ncbi:protein germ cell-less isoform X2 [Teleopsis dalmanni]|uniref:protein germ cell-less isoform X2 n=1 Tax=Teleopsis dalmanni TaxID=139649 RepID=UPI0018CF270D|nr:protein germ cell-less isoform X2 [Teleopsis dalmanni]
MGTVAFKLTTPLQESVTKFLDRKRKRPMEPTDGSDDKDLELEVPKKKKLLSTAKYIYKTLFEGQANSDITVMALGRTWRLHKLYLSQSPYFQSMFSGSWMESTQDFVNIQILDKRITVTALDEVFGSLYSDDIKIEVDNVVGILATATLFHLESIIEKCSEVMLESINAKSAVEYYDIGCAYGCLNAKKAAFDWLEKNMLSVYPKHFKLLRSISINLMTELVSSPDLYAMQTEFSIYTLLRTWAYLRLHPHFLNQADETKSLRLDDQSTEQHPTEVIQAFFVQRSKTCSFLATPDGQQFKKPFQALRTQYLTNHHTDLKIILADNIIPKEWISGHVLDHWNSILKVDHVASDEGFTYDNDVFLNNCMRCGRILQEPSYQKWRWTGFNFGLDLILIVESRVLSIRRHHRIEHERLLSLQTKRPFMIRASVTSALNGKTELTQTSDILSLSLEKNEERTIMLLDPKLVHPLLISVNLLVVDPPTNPDLKQGDLHTSEDINIPISDIGANSDRRSITPTSCNDSAIFVVTPTQDGDQMSAGLYPRLVPSELSHSLSSSISGGDAFTGGVNCTN